MNILKKFIKGMKSSEKKYNRRKDADSFAIKPVPKAPSTSRREPTVFTGFDKYELDQLEPLCLQKELLIAEYLNKKRAGTLEPEEREKKEKEKRDFIKKLEIHFKLNYSWLSSMLGYKSGGGENDDEHVTPFKFMIFFGGGIWKTPSTTTPLFSLINITEDDYNAFQQILINNGLGNGDVSEFSELSPLKYALLDLMFGQNYRKQQDFLTNLLVLMYGGIYLSEPLLNQIKSDALPIKYDHDIRKFIPSESWCKKMSDTAMYTSLAHNVDAIEMRGKIIDDYNEGFQDYNETHGIENFKKKDTLKGKGRLCAKASTGCPVHTLVKQTREGIPECIKCKKEELKIAPEANKTNLESEITKAENEWTNIMGIEDAEKERWITENLSICMCNKKITISEDVIERLTLCTCKTSDSVYDSDINKSNMLTILDKLCNNLNKFKYERAFYNSVLFYGIDPDNSKSSDSKRAGQVRVQTDRLKDVIGSPTSRRATTPMNAQMSQAYNSDMPASNDIYLSREGIDNCHVLFIDKFVKQRGIDVELRLTEVQNEIQYLENPSTGAARPSTGGILPIEKQIERLKILKQGLEKLNEILNEAIVEAADILQRFSGGGKVKRKKKRKTKRKRNKPNKKTRRKR